ncbi:hypothetical protein N2152v2_007667 [Parachlorella kessleri]
MQQAVSQSSQAAGSFDKESFEQERGRLDALARAEMSKQAEAVSSGQLAGPGAWKWVIRKEIWDMLEATNIAESPRPVHHRIPNYKGADRAAARLAELEEFCAAQVVKVNPDTPQKQVRHAVLSMGKTLLTPQPRLRTGFFSTLHKDHVPAEALLEACTSAGVQKYGRPLSLDDKLRVDLIVVGSVAVCRNGVRLGKGEGFAELEYGILRWMGAIDDSTLVVTTVRDEQIIEDIPPERLLAHDVPVDIIVTPTQVIRTNTAIPKPPGILWDKLSPQKLAQIRILQHLKSRIEEETGAPLPSGPPEKLPPVAPRRRRLANRKKELGRSDRRKGGQLGRDGTSAEDIG